MLKWDVMNTRVRRSHPGDWLAVETLHQKAHRRLPQLWWWEEHLADDVFILTERDKVVVGALLAWPDASPVAWIRLAALDDALDVDEWLGLTLPPVLDSLRRRGAQKLAWMDYDGWAGSHLQVYGFKRLNDVITLVKHDHTLPDSNPTNAWLRPTSDADIPTIVALDRAAFTPHWWHSEFTMLRRARAAAASYFVVAEVTDGVIGHAEGEVRLPVAHLNHIAVHPTHQGYGIGALLLNDVLRYFWQHGAGRVTLNTQTDNYYSQRLYHRFGFEPTGDVATAWELQL